MCGICGFVNSSTENTASRPLLEAMCRTIIHRGPDDEGIYLHRNAALGARRLSIIDLAGGHQPLSNEDGSIWIAYNGEVYNFPELREELAGLGHRFKTRTDTETLVHAYEEWGEAFPNKLRGMFAAALWDIRAGRLLLVRDRLGIKPLYYSLLKDGTLVFGSELKTILVHPGFDRQLEPRALDLFLTLEYIPAPYSIFKGIHKLPAGSLLSWSQGRTSVTKYWRPPHPDSASGESTRGEDDLQDELYQLLKESVRIRLISDVPLGAFLSGGIDSSSIVGLMRELGASPLKTFSIGFEDQTYNELDHARRIARKFETEHEEFIIKPQALELTGRLIHHLDEPFGDFSIFPTFLVSEMARRHVTVILSGDGGDEVFGGYEHYLAQKMAQNPLTAPARFLLAPLIKHLPPSNKKKGIWNKLQRFCQGFEYEPEWRHFRWMMFQTQKQKANLYSTEFQNSLGGIGTLRNLEPLAEHFSDMEQYDPVSGELHLDLNTYLCDDILVKVDRMSMAASLETRVPLIDHKIVEFMFRLPGTMKIKGKTTKWLFKQTMERLLPAENIHRRKEGFSIPIKHWLRSELKPLMLDYLDEPRIKRDGFFEPAAVQGMIASHLKGSANFSHQIWALLVFQIWKEHYLDSAPASLPK